MSTIPHRELRNSSSEILRRVEAGETFDITNNGKVVARLSPVPKASKLEELRAAGLTRPAKAAIDVSKLEKVTGRTSQDILDDLRGNR